MKREGAFFRGEPVAFLAALLLGWAFLRVVSWEPLPDGGLPLALAAVDESPASAAMPLSGEIRLSSGEAVGDVPLAAMMGRDGPPAGAAARRQQAEEAEGARAMPAAAVFARTLPETRASDAMSAAGVADMRIVQGDGHMRKGATEAAPYPVALPGSSVRPRESRWSGDAWLLVRRDAATPFTGERPSYGRSQTGAVLRYRLASSGWRPTAYVRASKALESIGESELAAGVSIRPLSSLPVSVAAEARAFDSITGREIRPAVLAVSEFPVARLPFALRGEAYVQTGYVGGDFATSFVDGQARVERQLVAAGPTSLRVGAGAWGGAQEGAERLDVGPTASVSVGFGAAQARLAADWRFRIGGNAEPASGPTLTVMAGF